jgi:hypothetical protein
MLTVALVLFLDEQTHMQSMWWLTKCYLALDLVPGAAVAPAATYYKDILLRPSDFCDTPAHQIVLAWPCVAALA